MAEPQSNARTADRRGAGRPKPTRQRGFSFVEILISVAILSLGLAALTPVYSNAVLAGENVKARTLARLRLQSLLAEVGATKPLAAGETSGAFDAHSSWRLTVEPYGAPSGRAPIAAFRVTASVEWRTKGKERALTLTTVRLGAGE